MGRRHGDAEVPERLARTELGRIPLIGRDLRVHALTGSPTAGGGAFHHRGHRRTSS
jgi:hypothetical protein